MNHAGRVAVCLAFLGLASIMAAPALASAGPAAGVAPHHATTAPVFIHFKPKSATGTQGGSVSVTAIVHNNGSFAFTATSCILSYRMGTSGAWTKAGSCLTASLFPHKFSAHSRQKFPISQKVASTFPTGVYEWKIVAVGTYHGATDDSHAGALRVTIT